MKQEWIRIDRNYLERIALRRKLVAEHPEICVGISDIANPAVRELYEEVMLDLLPKRFPTMFSIKGDIFYNLVTGARHRISAALTDHASMLRHLVENVEEDFFFMMPDAQEEFVLQGFVSCFPQGFLPATRVGMSVSEIHEPVPGYEGRLKKGVNRCFERMERGQSVGRLNVGSAQCLETKGDLIFLAIVGHPGQSLSTVSPIRRRQHTQNRRQSIRKDRVRPFSFLFAR